MSLDRVAEDAMRALRQFQEAHWVYFKARRWGIDPKTNCPYPARPDLDRAANYRAEISTHCALT